MDKQNLIDLLNEDLASEMSALIMYITYSAKASGPYRPQLSQFFLAEIADEQAHAQFLANKIISLGGEPTTTPSSVKHCNTNKEMLEAVLEAETQALESYTLRAKQAEEFGDKALAINLENIILDESNHRQETERFLHNWAV